MKCFTIINTSFVQGRMVVINEVGIGTKGLVASIGDNTKFPPPSMTMASIGFCVPPTSEHHLMVFSHADIFQYKDDIRAYEPVIIQEHQNESTSALVYWILDISNIAFQNLYLPDGFHFLAEKYQLTPGCMEVLFVLKMGEHITYKHKGGTITISWDGVHLNVESK